MITAAVRLHEPNVLQVEKLYIYVYTAMRVKKKVWTQVKTLICRQLTHVFVGRGTSHQESVHSLLSEVGETEGTYVVITRLLITNVVTSAANSVHFNTRCHIFRRLSSMTNFFPFFVPIIIIALLRRNISV